MNQPWHKDAALASKHFAVTPSDTVSMPVVTGIRCGSAGDITAVDEDGTAITYTVVAGEILPIKVRRVNSTGTTVTGIVGFR
jgi:hypothetical protein